MILSESTILKLLRKKANRPMKMAELVKCLAVPDEQRHEFRRFVKQMAAGGCLIKIRGGRYGLPDQMNLVSGTVQGHPNGYGFLISDNAEDIYIGRRNMAEAMHGDQIMARVEPKGSFNRVEGRVVRILERKTSTLVGTYETFGADGWVAPSEPKYFHDVFIPSKHKNNAKPGQLVCVEITDYPTRHQPPAGKVVEILGYAEDPEVVVRSILRKYGVYADFPFEALREAQQSSVSLDAGERKRRRDLTDWMIFTIDGESAKDFDDAVSIEKTETGYRLGVHIADVSHYVEENSFLDQEALERGTSVYFPDGVVPMLPFELSNEICSLKPGEERLAISALMEFDESGKSVGHEIFESIIRSQRRLTYTEATRLLREDGPEGDSRNVLPALKTMRDLGQILRQRRFRNGSVDFNIPETEIHLDEKGQVESIAAAEHNVAHEIIEEFMLAANQTVARRLDAGRIPSIHRIHEPPDPAKLEAFNGFIAGFGLKLDRVRDVRPQDLRKLVHSVRGKPCERVVNSLLLRSLKKATYSASNPGHFCLAFEHYTHFTSPIRRYPDLVIHRILKSSLSRRRAGRDGKKPLARIVEWAEQSTLAELRAMKVEREIVDLRRAQFMEDKVGKTYTGRISTVTSFGFFVELDAIFVEGLVHISTLSDDYYVLVEAEHKLQGQHKGKTYRIGDAVKARVAKVNMAARQIDFVVVKSAGARN